MADVLAAEWRKTLTARSTHIILGVVALFTGLMVLLAVYFVSVWDSLPPEGRANASLGGLPELLGWILSLCMAVFGTLAITSEYASGMIRTTFIAMPRRGRVLAAKALIVAGVTFVVSELALARHAPRGLGDHRRSGDHRPGSAGRERRRPDRRHGTVDDHLRPRSGSPSARSPGRPSRASSRWRCCGTSCRSSPASLRSPGATCSVRSCRVRSPGNSPGPATSTACSGPPSRRGRPSSAMLAYVAIPLSGALLIVMRRDA